MAALRHTDICLCTYKRPALLQVTLDHLRDLHTGGLFNYAIIVADNDRAESARATVEAYAATVNRPVTYCVETEQNISLARNKALEFARGDYIAWIDDDEFPSREWLRLLVETLDRTGADGVLGPVKPVFLQNPPAWITRGRFFDKPRRKTDLKLYWTQTSTANALVRREVVNTVKPTFRVEFGSGCEDLDFYRRAIAQGAKFVWCDEAIVSEIVPPTRWTRKYLFRRAYLRGQNGWRFATPYSLAKSLVALPLYLLLLPFLLLVGQHVFVRFLMKLGDHSGVLAAVSGIHRPGRKYLAG